MNSNSKNKNYLNIIPNDVLGYIYSFDSTYFDKMKSIVSDLHKLKRRENFINADHFVNIIDYSHDTILEWQSAFEDSVACDAITCSPVPFPPKKSLVSREPAILNDNAYIVLENIDAFHKLLRSNLLRKYNLDGWGIDVYSTENFIEDFIDDFMSI